MIFSMLFEALDVVTDGLLSETHDRATRRRIVEDIKSLRALGCDDEEIKRMIEAKYG